MDGEKVFHVVPCLHQDAQHTVGLGTGQSGHAFGHFLLYHARATGNKLFVFQHLEENLAGDVVGIVARQDEGLSLKNLFKIHLVKGNTISHEVVGKYGACSVLLKPAPEGTGIIAGGPVRAVLELAGVQNVCSKVYGSRAPINIVRAVNQGLESLKNYKEIKALRSKE
jgi:small subunit ribosomal protein S5